MLRFHSVFTSQMVLQRGKPIALSGCCSSVDAVKVTFAGATLPAAVDATGEWRAVFPPMAAGGPYQATVDDGHDSVTLDDILIGDVWFCSGQSNMEFPVGGKRNFFHLPDGEKVMAEANYPRIRVCNCCRRLADSPLAEVADFIQWRPCIGRNLEDFSALAYFFGRKLHLDTGVPVGLIHSSWGGASIEPWISQDKYRQMNYDTAAMSYDEWSAVWRAQLQREPALLNWIRDFEAKMPPTESAWLEDSFDDSEWIPCYKGDTGMPAAGRMVTRVHFSVPAKYAGRSFRFTIGPIMDLDVTYLNGKEIGRTRIDRYQYWISMRNYDVPAGVLKAGENLMVVVVDGHGGGTVEMQPLTLTFNDGTWIQLADMYCRSKMVATLPPELPPKPALPLPVNNGKFTPVTICCHSTMYNGMVAPWTRFAIKGILWYQGCGNAGEMRYYQLHQMLIDDWRERWGDNELPFILVQLAAYYQNSPGNRGDDNAVDALPAGELTAYSILREMQAEMPYVRRNVGLVASFDTGEAYNIHPFDKQTVGERLALKAEAMTGFTDALADGPEFDGIRYEGHCIRVFFKNAGTGLVTSDGEPPKSFWISDERNLGWTAAGESKFFRANARIEGDSVVLWHDMVPFPQRVHYAFTGFCKVNLYNREGLPALPFRSDKCDYSRMMR